MSLCYNQHVFLLFYLILVSECGAVCTRHVPNRYTVSFLFNNSEKTKASDLKANRVSYISILRAVIGLIGFFIMPAVSFYIFESITGNLSCIAPFQAFLNICLNLCLYLFILGISGTTRIAVPVSSALLFMLALAETFTVEFRSRPIMPWDITSVGTALSVTENYVFKLSDAMIEGLIVLITVNILLLFFPFRVRRLKSRLELFCGCIALILGFNFAFYKYIMPEKDYQINVWDIDASYTEYGYMLSSAVSMKYVFVKPPTGYSQARLKQLADELEGYDYAAAGADDNDSSIDINTDYGDSDENAAVTPVNIICIMNESFSDLSVAGDFETNTDYMPFLHSLSDNTIKGSLCVPVFGSMTSNTEFEFLTGDSMSVLPFNSNAYQFNISDGELSLVSTLKAQGYEAIAMHPYPAENWNRLSCYKNLGFDEFYDIEYYDSCEELRNYVSDRADYDKLIEQVESKASPDDKLFIFNVTMQNHGGYDTAFDNFNEEVFLTGSLYGRYPEADRYLSLIKKSDEAFQYLLNYFSQSDEPTMIVMFGDHQPAVEDAFYDDISGIPSSEVSTEDRIMWYQTPFFIWTNYEQPSEDIGMLGSTALSSYVLKAAGLKMTPYNKYILKLSEDVPVVHPFGCFDKDNIFYYWAKAESDRCPYAEEILKYRYLAYNHCLDSRKLKALFSVDD